MEPLVPTAVLASVLGLIAYFRGQRRRREGNILTEFAIRHPGVSFVADEEGSLVVLHRGLPITVGFGVPSGKSWARGLFARASYAIGAGPAFEASARDVTVHTRKPNGAYPLHARVERAYDVTGQHREGRALLLPVLTTVPSDRLPAPLFSASHDEVRVYLPEFVPDAAKEGSEAVEQLVALTGELALFGQEVLSRYAETLGGRVIIDRLRRPRLSARFSDGPLEGELSLLWQASGEGRAFRLSMSMGRAHGHVPDVQVALRDLPTRADRELATRALKSGELQIEEAAVSLAFDTLLGPDELPVLATLLGHLAGSRRMDGPFR